jgi:quercetin dioxygenase-like cupin family protein
MKHFRALLFLAILALTAAATFSQKAAPGTTLSPVELSNEPHHRLKYENGYVRVWDTLIPPGESTLWHRHENDNVVITLGNASIRVETVGAAPVESQVKFGDVGFRKATYVHRSMSVGDTPFHNMAIEILKSPTSDSLAKVKQQIGREPVIDNDRVRVYKLSLAPGESTGMHTHLLAGLGIMLSPAEIELETQGKDAFERIKVDVGDVRWRPGAVTHSVKNVGKTRFEAIDIELK